MEVARPPGGFLMPHQMMIHHETRWPAPSPAPAATEQPRRVRVRVRMRTGPHEFYDGTMLTATRSVLGVVVVDGEAAVAASFAAWAWPPMRRVAGLPETTAGVGGGGAAAAAAASFAAWPMRRVPAAGSAVAGLPETTAGAVGGEEGGEACCAVCLDGYAAGDALRTMPCAHAFHAGCIVEWLSFGPFCPLCRFRLPTQAEEEDAAQAQQPPPRLG
ncbi:unnamed protein product [Urochloa decumbens]|uniref:RING-type domain-containing protein n=1 Tax=Urochloa decumbens TaxID=240449 RepID=A0ABC9B6D7_9POAL